MTTPRKSIPLSDDFTVHVPYGPHSFDVTCIVGTVVLGGGNQSPYVAAMTLIAEHEGPGTFTFPLNERIITVTVDFGSLPGEQA